MRITSGVRMSLLAVALLVAGLQPGCGRAGGELRISGPGDLYYMSVALNQSYAPDAGLKEVSMSVSRDAVNELKRGKTDAVFIGREPAPEELDGLKDYVVAYDAVTIILDANSYLGGKAAPPGGRPSQKTSGLRQISADDLTLLFSSGWMMSDGYYDVRPGLDPDSAIWEREDILWIKTPKPITPGFIFPQGKFDTQTVLYQRLGLDEAAATANRTSFSWPQFSREEQVLSYEYNNTGYGQTYGIQAFAFDLKFASRRSMTVAPNHVPVKVLAVDGIDPLEDTQAVYDGTYPFSRKIHFLVKDNAPAKATRLAEFLLSAEGQAMLADAGYLPLPRSR